MAPDRSPAPDEAERIVRAHARLAPVAGLDPIRLHAAHPGSGLGRLGAKGPPYWAFPWPGGLALAQHVLALTGTVRGRRVLDLGAGSGLVAIAASLAGAGAVHAAEIDPLGRAAIRLNAAANAAAIDVVAEDMTAGPPPSVDLILAGDVFYDETLAERVFGFLTRCRAAGIDVLVGDPGRAPLPRACLDLVAEYDAPEVGAGSSSGAGRGFVFALR